MTVLTGTMTPGAVLSGARKAAGLSVADVAAQMRLSPRQVEALEADRYGDLPGAVFVRGFIRNYARVLKLDPVPLLHALEPALDEESPLRVRATSGTLPLTARRDHARPLLILFSLLLVVVAAAGGYELWSRQREQAGKAGEVADAGGGTTQTLVTPEKAEQSIPAAAAPSDPPPPETAQHAGSAAEHPTAAPLSDQASAQAAPAASNARMGRLRVQFTAATWLEVRDRSGALVYSGTEQAGAERELEAAAPVTVVIGNAKGVRITYNGEALDLSAYAARNIARLTLE